MKYLGVMLDQNLSPDPQIRKIISSGYMHLHRIWSIRDCLTEKTAAALVVTLVLSHLDYCNSLLTAATIGQLQRLQHLQNSAARVIKRLPRWTRMTPVLNDLHWLPVRQRVEFKTLSIVFKCETDTAPTYLRELLKPHNPTKNLRSSKKRLLNVP